MTKQEAINRAKSSILLSMTRLLDSSNVSNAIASFAADNFNCDCESCLDKINAEVDSMIKRLNMLKAVIEDDKQAIIKADK